MRAAITIVATKKSSEHASQENEEHDQEAVPAKSKKATQYVYAFGKKTDGGSAMRNLLGGKGANLAEMASIGLPVPPGFTISTDVCTLFLRQQPPLPGVS